MVNHTRIALAAIAVVIPLAMVATLYTDSEPQTRNSAGSNRPVVVASFYPLYEFASQVAGDRAEVSSLVPTGIEPHDWEPTFNDISTVRSADLVVINGAGFEAWSEEIDSVRLIDTSEGIEQEEEGLINPHFWLDPVLAIHQVERIRDGLIAVDPENADYYHERADRFISRLNSLDSLITSELADCQKSDFIAFHDAFAHFAKRYGLTQHSILGVSPEGEIPPQRIEQVIALANELDIIVIYAEELIDSRLAETIAAEIRGGRVLVLSPMEGIDKEEQQAGVGYIEKMEENLANLKEGLDCR